MEIINHGNYKIVHLTDGKLVSEAARLINSHKAEGVNFNYIKNFPADINHIIEAKGIKYIQINDYSWSYDYSAINELTTLEHLSVYTTDKKEIDFSKYPVIKSAAIYWRIKAASLFNCSTIQELFIGKYNEPNLIRFENLVNLKYLRINTGSIKTLKGIEKLQNLQTLLLTQVTKLEDIESLRELTNLKYLTIDNCRNINNINVLSQLAHLRKIHIIGTTPKPI